MELQAKELKETIKTLENVKKELQNYRDNDKQLTIDKLSKQIKEYEERDKQLLEIGQLYKKESNECDKWKVWNAENKVYFNTESKEYECINTIEAWDVLKYHDKLLLSDIGKLKLKLRKVREHRRDIWNQMYEFECFAIYKAEYNDRKTKYQQLTKNIGQNVTHELFPELFNSNIQMPGNDDEFACLHIGYKGSDEEETDEDNDDDFKNQYVVEKIRKKRRLE